MAAVDAARVNSGAPALKPVMRGGLPLVFEPNHGQVDARVQYLSRGPGYTLYLSGSQAILRLSETAGNGEDGVAPPGQLTARKSVRHSELRLRFLGARERTQPEAVAPLASRSNYFIGKDPARWRTGIPHFTRVRYPDLYPGVDLVFYGREGRLEYDFELAPGADPGVIRLAFDGHQSIRVASNGDLVLQTGLGEVRQRKPLVYQFDGDTRVELETRHVLKRDGTVRFEVAGLDRRKPLTIDPVLTFSTYFGGSGYDHASKIAVGGDGSIYLAGDTTSVDFPATSDAYQRPYLGSIDVFIVKLNPDATQVLYSSYFGGSSEDRVAGLAVDSSGNAYIGGYTLSPNFPTTPGAFQTWFGGFKDMFIAKLSPDGSSLVYSTLYGGSAQEEAGQLAITQEGEAWAGGETASGNLTVTPDAFQPYHGGGGKDAFVVKLNATGTGLEFASYLGGNGHESLYGIAVDSAGNAYLGGATTSSNFPTTVGAFQSVNRGDHDAYLVKLSPAGTPIYSTYFGGSGFEGAGPLIPDGAGNLLFTSLTSSANLPVTPSAPQSTHGGGWDAYVAKLNADGSAVLYCTYLGGTGDDRGSGIGLDSLGAIYVSGLTGSTNFPIVDALQPAYGGGEYDGFLTKIKPSSASLVYSTFLGGTGLDEATGLAVSPASGVYLAGSTYSANFPTASALQPVYAGGGDSFIAKITDNSPPVIAAEQAAITANEGGTAANTGTVSDPDAGDTVTLTASLGTVNETAPGVWTWSMAAPNGPSDAPVTITATDGRGAQSQVTFSLHVNNVAPVVAGMALAAAQIDENGLATLNVTIADPGVEDSHTGAVNWGDGTSSPLPLLPPGSSAKTITLQHQYMDDNPAATSADTYGIAVNVADSDGGTAAAGVSIVVRNLAPAMENVSGPSEPLPLGAPATVSASFTDAGTQDTHTCVIDWDDGQPGSAGTVTGSGGTGSCTGTKTYAAAGVYRVTVTVTDDDTGSVSRAREYVVVYDPSAGFVTGGGWINSLQGAYSPNPALAGKANFGFVSRYQKGASVPTGQTQFEFEVAGFSFRSSQYDWLVVAGAKAQYKGSGTVNGAGDYGFLLTATDGALAGGGGADKFRVKIWDKATGLVVYDNVRGASDDVDAANPQVIGGGSIVIHNK